MKFLDRHFGRSGNRMFQSFYLYAQMREGKIPDVFLQDCKYFDKYRPELMKMAFGNTVSDYREVISIHLRKGGNPSVPEEPAYSENPFYVNLSATDYYQKAMELFPNQQFLVFSDDLMSALEFCKGKKDCYYWENKGEEEDFEAMAKCMGHIIANSSFSYMAAYLGGGKTVYPRQWFADGIKRVGMPTDWIEV